MSTINIFSRFYNKGFKDAESALKASDRRTKYWAKKQAKYYAAATAAATFYAQRVLRTAVREASADEKSQRVLATTLQNVAMATDNTVASTEAQIRTLQNLYGIADDQLRPSLARLVRSTGNVNEAFDGLNIALNIAAATGKNLDAVTAALGKAYDGNYASLQRLGLGLDANLLKTKDADKIMGTLRDTFSGFARKEAATAEGKFRRIGVAADDAAEIIGVALIDAIAKVADQGGNDIDGLTTKMNRFAEGVASIIRQIGDLTATATAPTATKLPWYLDIGTTLRDFLYSQTIFGFINREGDKAIKQAEQRAKLAQIERNRTEFSVKNRRAELRLAEYLIKKRKEETKEKPKPEVDTRTLEQLMAEEAARRAGFKLTEDIDSIQTVAAARRLEEARQYKMQVLDAAQAQYDAIKNNVTLLDAVWKSQLTAFDVFLAALKAKASQTQIAIGFNASNVPSSPLSSFRPGSAIDTFSPVGDYNYSEGMPRNWQPPSAPTNVMNVSVNAFGTQDFLTAVQQAQQEFARNGWSSSYAGR